MVLLNVLNKVKDSMTFLNNFMFIFKGSLKLDLHSLSCISFKDFHKKFYEDHKFVQLENTTRSFWDTF